VTPVPDDVCADYIHEDRRIRIKPSLSTAARWVALFHELGHVMEYWLADKYGAMRVVRHGYIEMYARLMYQLGAQCGYFPKISARKFRDDVAVYGTMFPWSQ